MNEETKKLIERYVKPHKKISRDVESKDIQRVLDEAVVMHDLCYLPYGIHNGGYAVAHQQIDDKDPLRFFVLRDSGRIIINPKIVNHTRHTVDSEEGCLSFPENTPIIIQRWNKIEVEYQTIGPADEDETGKDDSEKRNNFESLKLVDIKEGLNGLLSKIYQHEIGHFDCNYIFDI